MATNANVLLTDLPSNSRRYWEEDGLVTGGQYGTKEGCQPYLVPKCDHHTTGM